LPKLLALSDSHGPQCMFNTLKTLFDKHITSVVEDDNAEDALPLAIAALLFEISRADHEIHADERRAMSAAVAQVCTVPAEDIDALLASADEAVEDAVSLYEFTSVVNEQLTREKKYELLELLWRVAYADGRIDRYEEYYVRKIADLLHLSQREFIRAKHAAQS
jgi:uncharacterized tellurite resistance protein B-like protein